jgi:excisionase family DNA binding protein
MNNPFELIIERLNELEHKLTNFNPEATNISIEVINRKELCKRLDITEPTAIRWEKKGKIPSIRIGSNVRYNWPAVIQALESK